MIIIIIDLVVMNIYSVHDVFLQLRSFEILDVPRPINKNSFINKLEYIT